MEVLQMFGPIDILLIIMLFALIGYAVYAMKSALQDRSFDAAEGLVEEKHIHHIPFSLEQIRDALLGLLNTGEKPPRDLIGQWKEFIQQVDLYYAAKYHLEKDGILNQYALFDPSIASEKGSDANQLAAFLTMFREMLKTANFRPLTKAEMENATEHNFQCTVPLEAEWSKLEVISSGVTTVRQKDSKGKEEADAEIVSDEESESEELPEFADRLWIFHRGMGVEKFTGLLLMEKVDTLLEKIFSKCCGPKKAAQTTAADAQPEQKAPRRCCGCKKAATTEAKPEQEAAQTVAAEAKPEQETAEPGGVQRMSLIGQMARQGWKTWFLPSTLQEPTFKEVVMLYRMKPGVDELHASGNPSALFMKIFRDIPHADLEMIYPAKRTRMSPIAVVKFIGVAISGIVSMLMQRQGSDVAGSSALVGFVGLLVTVVFNYQIQMARYAQQTLGDIYKKTKDADKGAVNYIMDEVGLQEVKEVVLAFWFLRNSSKPRTAKQLDEQVEAFLLELQTLYGSHECKIDFEVSDALHKLRDMKLATVDDEGHFSAIELIEAVERLTKLWGHINDQSIAPTRLSSLPTFNRDY